MGLSWKEASTQKESNNTSPSPKADAIYNQARYWCATLVGSINLKDGQPPTPDHQSCSHSRCLMGLGRKAASAKESNNASPSPDVDGNHIHAKYWWATLDGTINLKDRQAPIPDHQSRSHSRCLMGLGWKIASAKESNDASPSPDSDGNHDKAKYWRAMLHGTINLKDGQPPYP